MCSSHVFTIYVFPYLFSLVPTTVAGADVDEPSLVRANDGRHIFIVFFVIGVMDLVAVECLCVHVS